MIDTKEMRELASAYVGLTAWTPIPPQELIDFLDRLEAAEEERDNLRALVVMRFDHDYPPQFTQGHNLHELNEPVTAEHCRWFVAEIERLRTDCNALRAKVAEMEKQEPVAFALYSGGSRRAVYLSEIEACEQRDRRQLTADLGGSLEAYRVVPLYALPGTQTQPTPSAPGVPLALLIAVADLAAQMEIVARSGFVDTPDDKDSCAAFCVAEGAWLELMRCVESLASALAAAPEAKP